MNTDKTPYTILALAPFAPTGESPKIEAREINAFTMDSVMEDMSPRLWIPLSQAICPEGGITIAPRSMKDLTPDGIIENVPYLKRLFEAREFIRSSGSKGMLPADIASSVRGNWPDLHLELSLPHPAQSAHTGGSAIDEILSMVTVPGVVGRPASGAGRGIEQWIGEIDHRLQSVMNHIFDNSEWRIFEAAWRGAGTLVKKGATDKVNNVAVKIIPLSRDTLPSILDKVMAGVEDMTPDVVIIDIPFDQKPLSQDLIEKTAAFASTLLVPAAIWIIPEFLNLEKWGELHRLPYLKTHIDSALFAKWRKLMESPDGNWLAALCNRFLVRPLYGKDYKTRHVFFEESKPLWISPVWAFAALVAESVEKFGWPSHFADYREIKLSDLAVFGESGAVSATEALFSDDRIHQFAGIGITALCGAAMADVAFFQAGVVASGESLLFQLFFSRMIGYLIRMRDKASGYTGESIGPSEYIRGAVEKLFNVPGSGQTLNLEVKAGDPDERGLVPVKIVFTPPSHILPGKRKIEFTFYW